MLVKDTLLSTGIVAFPLLQPSEVQYREGVTYTPGWNIDHRGLKSGLLTIFSHLVHLSANVRSSKVLCHSSWCDDDRTFCSTLCWRIKMRCKIHLRGSGSVEGIGTANMSCKTPMTSPNELIGRRKSMWNCPWNHSKSAKLPTAYPWEPPRLPRRDFCLDQAILYKPILLIVGGPNYCEA